MKGSDAYILPTLVFVYGTLRKARGNHHVLGDSEFVGIDFTTPDHVMACAGIPFVRMFNDDDTPDIVGRVEGEVYRVSNDRVMQSLDMLEGHPNAYCRRLTILESGRQAWLYYYDNPRRGRWSPDAFINPDKEGVISYGARVLSR